MDKTIEQQIAILKKIVDEKNSEFTYLNSRSITYHGGDRDCDIEMNARYSENAPNKTTNVSINDVEHKDMVDFQLNLICCPLCEKVDIYLTKFKNVGNYLSSGFGYDSVDMEYYCPNCKLEYRSKGGWGF